MSSAYIRSTLDGVLTTWVNTVYPKIPIAYENAAFTKPSPPATYLQTYLLPAKTMNPTTDGGRKRETGIYQISLWYPIGGGMGAIEALESSLVDLFPVMPKFSDVSIERTPTTSKALNDTSGYRVIYISVYYRYES